MLATVTNGASIYMLADGALVTARCHLFPSILNVNILNKLVGAIFRSRFS